MQSAIMITSEGAGDFRKIAGQKQNCPATESGGSLFQAWDLKAQLKSEETDLMKATGSERWAGL